jgi:hypothetical protein
MVGSSGLASVRFYTGETSSGTAVLTDEEINAVLTNVTANHYLAAAMCCENLAAHYAIQVDTRNEGLDVAASQRAKAYERRALAWRVRAGLGAAIAVGGRSKQEKIDRADDTDLVQPGFEKDQHSFAGTVASSTDGYGR